MTELVTGRGAAAILATDGIARGPARRLLAAGLAGTPVVTGAATLFEKERVQALIERPSVEADRLPPPADRVLLELRVRPGTGPAEWATLANAGCLASLRLRDAVRRHGLVPLVATCHSFVLGGADVRTAWTATRSTVALDLRGPGAWFAAFDGRRLYSPAGNCWHLWTPDPRVGA